MNQARSDQYDILSRLPDNDPSIIKLDNFIVATRDSGYKGTNSAIAELVDNALQAEAKTISIDVHYKKDQEKDVMVGVLDNGCGMDPMTLRQSLRFGGSSRFGNRNGLGRFGMGLPNSSLSQSRRVEVFSWTNENEVWYSYIDVDEVVRGDMNVVPEPVLKGLPGDRDGEYRRSGTLVLWTRCDRLDNRRISTLNYKLTTFLGRIFRYFLWESVKILVNGQPIRPIDPLYLRPDSVVSGATQFGEPLTYKVRAPSYNGEEEVIGEVKVHFSELPIQSWQSFSNEEKRKKGISKGAGVSVVRAGREVDYGWFFMNGKRKENYDDWWRCEIQFDPVLDEVFGITHTKQQVRPQEYLSEILSTDIGEIARSLNNRVRQAHVDLNLRKQSIGSAQIAANKEGQLRPLPLLRPSTEERVLLREAEKSDPKPEKEGPQSKPGIQYNILHKKLPDSNLYSFTHNKDRFVLNLNPEHPFYRKVYKPLTESDSPRDLELREKIELLILAAARSEALVNGSRNRQTLAKHRLEWSKILVAFLKG